MRPRFRLSTAAKVQSRRFGRHGNESRSSAASRSLWLERKRRVGTKSRSSSHLRRAEGTAEHRRTPCFDLLAVDDIDNRGFAVVVALVGTSCRDAAREDEVPLRIVQQGLTGSLGAEGRRLRAVRVSLDGDSVRVAESPLQRSAFVRIQAGKIDDRGYIETAIDVLDQPMKFGYACDRTLAKRVEEHVQVETTAGRGAFAAGRGSRSSREQLQPRRA